MYSTDKNITNIRVLLGASSENFTDEQILLCLQQAESDIEAYCHRIIDQDFELLSLVNKMAIIQLNRLGTEGLSSQGFSGVTETYVSGYPEDIMAVLRSKRKLKVV